MKPTDELVNLCRVADPHSPQQLARELQAAGVYAAGEACPLIRRALNPRTLHVDAAALARLRADLRQRAALQGLSDEFRAFAGVAATGATQ